MATTIERSGAMPVEPYESRLAMVRRISWGSVFAGVVVALVVQLVLGVLGLAVGFGSVNLSGGQNPLPSIGMGAGIWYAVSVLISLFLGGWVAGRLAGIPRTIDSSLHGILTWGVTTLVTIYLMTTTIGAIISGTASVIGKGLDLVGRGIGAAASTAVSSANIDIGEVTNDIKTILAQTGKPELQPRNLERRAREAGRTAQSGAAEAAKNPGDAGDELTATWGRIVASGKDVIDAADREALVNVLVARTTMSRPEAEQTVSRWETTYQQAKVKFNQVKADAEQKARQVTDTAAHFISQAALWTFIGFIFGAVAAALGGYLSRPRDIAVPVERTV